MTDVPVDERGIPTETDGTSAPHCPANPCVLCTGNSAVVIDYRGSRDPKDWERQTSWEWCQEMDTCAATVDWEKVYGRE